MTLRRLISLSLLLAGLLAVPKPGVTQTVGIDVEFVAGGELTLAAPGEVITVAYRVTAGGPWPRTLVAEAMLPDSWRLVNQLEPIEVTNGEPVIGFMTFRVGRASDSGLQEIRVRFTDQDRQSQSGIGAVSISVGSVSGITLAFPSPREYARAGERLEIPFRITNRGNRLDQVILDVTGPPEADLRLDSSQVRLGPLESRTVTLLLDTDPRLSLETVYEIYLHARSTTDPSSFESRTTRIHVIPGFGELNRRAETRPLNVSIQSVGNEDGGSGQIGARTNLDLLGGRVDMEMLVTNRDRTPMFGSRETYRFGYTSNFLGIRVGDQTQQQSPLTTYGDYGAGLGIEIKGKSWFMSGFGQRSRYRFPREGLSGWSLGYKRNDKTRFSLNGVRRGGGYGGSAITARTELRPFGDEQNLDLECGLDSGQGLDQPSCSAALRLSRWDATYTGRFSSLSETHPGYQRGSTEMNSKLAYSPLRGLKLEASWRRQETGILNSIRKTDHQQIGSSYNTQLGRFRASSRLHLAFRQWDYFASMVSIDRLERSLRFQQGLNTNRLSLNGTVDFGRSISEARGYDGGGRRFQLSARYAPSRSVSLSIVGEQASGYLNGSTRPADRTMLNVRGRARVGERSDLSVSYYQNVISNLGTGSLRYTTGRASFRHRLKGGHEILMQAQVSAVPNSDPGYAADYQLSYAFPLNVPVGKPSSQRILVGRVFDADTGRGMEDVLVTMGASVALTDSEGWFEVLRPDDYLAFLSLDPSTIGYESVSMVSMPLGINPDHEMPDILELPIARAAFLRGQVSVFGSSTGSVLLGDTGPMVEIAGLGNVVLGLKSSANEYRARTGASGHYEFRHVAPGDYELRVITHPRMEDYRFETDSLAISLAGGETVEAELKVLPRRPRIRIIAKPGGPVALPTLTTPAPSADTPRGTRTAEDSQVQQSEVVANAREWSDDPAFSHSVALPVSSRQRARQFAEKLSDMGYVVRIGEHVLPDADTALAFDGEGIANLLKRNGLSASTDNVARFRELNPEVLSASQGLPGALRYRLPDTNRLKLDAVVHVGQFRNTSSAEAALRDIAPLTTWRAHIVTLK
ncbi:MAG: hypothetical protein HKN29_06495 [Rhodothermales bacterium]|nr:hypothetical protein [Rhodothermales bacterium]